MQKSSVLENICNLVNEKLGILLTPDKADLFYTSMKNKSKLITKLSESDYIDILKSNSFESHPEWKIILETLNISETYFFRDNGQIEIIEKEILPILILKNAQNKNLQIWSAGCSTGEEVYTISILLHQIILDITSWQIKVLGTDLNQDSIAKAKKGEFFSWSFRNISTKIINSFFIKIKENLLINENLKYITEFKNENLLYSKHQNEFDLIVCRNVFIYLNEETKKQILINFEKALKPDSYLILGHSEIGNFIPESFEPILYSGSVVYKKKNPDKVTIPIKNVEKIGQQTTKIKLPSLDGEEFAKAKSFANSGKFIEAKLHCQKAISLNKENYDAYYLLGHILESENDYLGAIQTYKKLILMNPDYLEAYLNLASIYNISGNQNASLNTRRDGLEILNSKPHLRDLYQNKGYNMKNFESFFTNESAIWI